MSSVGMLTEPIPLGRIELSEYVLTEELGRGAHGAVYRGHHRSDPAQALAVKIVEHTAGLDTLLLEPEILSRLDHPNIVGLRDYFLHAGKLVLVLDYIPGVDLQHYLQSLGRPLSAPEVFEFLAQIASALAHAHALQIIHRDIKPSNIIVTGEAGARRYILADFGVSRLAHGIQTVRQIAGTVHYMAPEQLRGRPVAQSDLWSLGVVAYWLLFDQLPFQDATLESLSERICFDTPLPPAAQLGDLDPDLIGLIMRLLEKEPSSRVISAQELLAEITRLTGVVYSVDTQHGLVAASTRSGVRNRRTDEQMLQRQIIWCWIWFGLFFFISTVPTGVIGDILIVGGLFLVYLSQDRQQQRLIAILGLTCLFASQMYYYVYIQALSYIILHIFQDNINQISTIINEVNRYTYIPLLISVGFLLSANRKRRDLLIHRTIHHIITNREIQIEQIGKLVDIHVNDLYLRQKYAELLFAAGKQEEATIEAKMMIEIDPYNFGANLLLSQGYYSLQLYNECTLVCDNYLATSGNSFEFFDLKQRCQTAVGDEHAL